MSKIKKNKPWQVRNLSPGEHPLGDISQIIIFVLFFVVWSIDTFFFSDETQLESFLPIQIKILFSFIMLSASSYLAVAGLNLVYDVKREKAIVISKSVFKIIRHPIYVGEILFYLSFVFLSASIPALVILIIAVVIFYYLSKYEERIMLSRFGERYIQYKREVPMWIPRLYKIKNK